MYGGTGDRMHVVGSSGALLPPGDPVLWQKILWLKLFHSLYLVLLHPFHDMAQRKYFSSTQGRPGRDLELLPGCCWPEDSGLWGSVLSQVLRRLRGSCPQVACLQHTHQKHCLTRQSSSQCPPVVTGMNFFPKCNCTCHHLMPSLIQ